MWLFDNMSATQNSGLPELKQVKLIKHCLIIYIIILKHIMCIMCKIIDKFSNEKDF